jgi:hypothetical protein
MNSLNDMMHRIEGGGCSVYRPPIISGTWFAPSLTGYFSFVLNRYFGIQDVR